ncbi:hypothetical protein QYM36_019190, partial [Artemia franciscana]
MIVLPYSSCQQGFNAKTHVGKNLVELMAGSVEMTPLNYALQEGQTSVVHYLLEKGANPVNSSDLSFQDRVNSSDPGLNVTAEVGKSTPQSSCSIPEEQKEPAPSSENRFSDVQTPQLAESGLSKPSSQRSRQKLKTKVSKVEVCSELSLPPGFRMPEEPLEEDTVHVSALEQLKVKGKLSSELVSAVFEALSTSKEEVKKLEDDNMRLLRDLEGEEQIYFLSEALTRSQDKGKESFFSKSSAAVRKETASTSDETSSDVQTPQLVESGPSKSSSQSSLQ